MDSAPRASATDSARTTATNGRSRHGLIDLARVAVEDTVRLVQQEIQLAKIELKEMLQSNLKAAIYLGTAAFCGLLFFIMLLVTRIETVLFLVLAIILALVGKGMLKIGPPPKTMTTLKEDAEWAKQVLKRNGKKSRPAPISGKRSRLSSCAPSATSTSRCSCRPTASCNSRSARWSWPSPALRCSVIGSDDAAQPPSSWFAG